MSDVDPASVEWFADPRDGTGQAETLDPLLSSILTEATESSACDQALGKRDREESVDRDRDARQRGRKISERLNRHLREQGERQRENDGSVRLARHRLRRSLVAHDIVWAIIGLGPPITSGIIALSVRGQAASTVALTLFVIGVFGGAILLISLVPRLIVAASPHRL